jgi:hypothetical protein
MDGWMDTNREKDRFGHKRGDGGIGVFVFGLFKFSHERYPYDVYCSSV